MEKKYLFILFIYLEISCNIFPFVYSCSYASSKPSPESAITAFGHSLPSAVQPLQPTGVRTLLPDYVH